MHDGQRCGGARELRCACVNNDSKKLGPQHKNSTKLFFQVAHVVSPIGRKRAPLQLIIELAEFICFGLSAHSYTARKNR